MHSGGLKEIPGAEGRIEQHVGIAYRFPVLFGQEMLSEGNPALARVIATAAPACTSVQEAGPHRLAAFLDDGAVRAFPSLPDKLSAYARAHLSVMELAAPPVIVQGGEKAKADSRVVDSVLEAVFKHKLCRQSFILALGGGAMLDAVGFAAATAHRGVRLIRMPSTSLAQCDAGVGLKNGVNRFGRKNFWGVFAPPFAVLNDFALLRGLDERDLRAGLAEAVKVSLVRDREAFMRMAARKNELGALDFAAVEPVLEECAAAHLKHIATCGDPFELGSARPLDFGHWLAHALEELSHGDLRHGEAVSVGIALDSVYSTLSGLLPPDELEQILALLAAIDLPLTHPLLESMDRQTMEDAVQSFREHLGGMLHVTLLREIGDKVEVNELDMERMLAARGELLRRAALLKRGAP